jgi:asparagine synthase (glutamine-hydrolysing)
MCGICGILGTIGDTNRTALRRMSSAMAHRGPDAEGMWESPPDAASRGVLFAHRRLSILDLSPAGAQPMVDAETGDVVCFNGEIYNYRSLRDRLVGEGHRFESSGDTAVMLRALGVHGREAVTWLRGMFAFGFWDSRRRELLLARDALGIKPLYLATNPDPAGAWSIAFASEVRALLASGLLPHRRLNLEAAASVVWNGFVPGPDTIVQGVESMWPGERRAYDAAGRRLEARRYWTAARSAAPPPSTPVEVAAALEEGVGLHLASDVPLAVFLSGGVDSSVVANLAQRAARTPIHTFTLTFEEDQYNEGPVARRIAEAIGTDHQEILLREADFIDGLDAALDSIDQPTFDGLNSFYMSRAIRAAGFTVALVGTGGDELFGGYTSFRDLPRLRAAARALGWIPPSVQAALAGLLLSGGRRAGRFPPQTRWAKLPEMLRQGDDLVSLYQLAYALFLPDFQRELLDGTAGTAGAAGLSQAMRLELEKEIEGRSTLSALSVLEQRLFLGERLLRDNDAASMAPSIEQRLPLVDQTLFEVVDRLPDEVRYAPVGRKALLRQAGLTGLPPELFERPKSGFVLPFDRWIRLRLGESMDRTMRDPEAAARVGLDPRAVVRLWDAYLAGAPGLYWSRVWAVYVLIRWCHRHEVFR